MNQHITTKTSHIDISVMRISYGTYEWTLYAGDVKLTAVNNNARDFDEFNDRHNLEPSYFGQVKRDLADYIAAMNGWSITFTA